MTITGKMSAIERASSVAANSAMMTAAAHGVTPGAMLEGAGRMRSAITPVATPANPTASRHHGVNDAATCSCVRQAACNQNSAAHAGPVTSALAATDARTLGVAIASRVSVPATRARLVPRCPTSVTPRSPRVAPARVARERAPPRCGSTPTRD